MRNEKEITNEKLAFELEHTFCRDGQAPLLNEAARRLRAYGKERNNGSDCVECKQLESLQEQLAVARKEIVKHGIAITDVFETRPENPEKGNVFHNRILGRCEIFTDGIWQVL